jgi:hypothetical protein
MGTHAGFGIAVIGRIPPGITGIDRPGGNMRG